MFAARTVRREARSDGTLHLLNPLWDAHGGADRRTVDLFRLLRAEARVRLWSEYAVAPAFRDLPVERVRPLHHPADGTLVIVGVYFRVGWWIRRCAAPIVVVYNTEQPDRLAKLLRRIGRPVRIVYTSHALRARTLDEPALAAIDRTLLDSDDVLESYVDPSPFVAGERPRRGASFVVGRLSRDRPRKHHPDDPAFYASLATLGMRVRVMGGRSLADRVEPRRGIELLDEGAQDAGAFLSGLDAFFYRNRPDYFEAFGRVVLEAMLCGVPVVVDARGGYARHIVQGRNGFLFERPTEALRQLSALRDDAALRERIGRAARASALRLFVDELPARTRQILLGTSTPARRFRHAA